jgi:release factor glutamine methyltransferase
VTEQLAATDLVLRLRAAGCVYAEDEAALLSAAASQPAELEPLIRRRIAGEPLEQVLGWADFCGLRLTVRPGVFVPRTRTELLVEQAVPVLREGAVLVDLCCGVGAVAAAIVDRVPGLEIFAVDLDPIAIECARENLAGRAEVFCGDLFEPLPARLQGRVSMITANAPYVPTGEIAYMPTEARDHENPVALDGGDDGLEVHRAIIGQASGWLAPDGRLMIETGRAQAKTDLELLRAAGFEASMIIDDEIDGTVVVGTRLGTDGSCG